MSLQDNFTPVIVVGGLEFDLPGVLIGTAEYAEGPTGCSVFRFPKRAACEVDRRGGSAAVYGGFPSIDALFLSGGSHYGLEVGSGIASEILSDRNSASAPDIASVSGAIIYDYYRRKTLAHPDKRLAAAAYHAARPGRYPVGPRGAGCSASVGQLGYSKRFGPEPGGQGCAVGKLGNASIGVFSVLNPLGAIFGEDGKLLRGYVDRTTGERRSLEYIIEHHPEEVGLINATAGGHTTITAVIIDKKIPTFELQQLGRQVHTSMAQVIRPFHTPLDGDVLFAVSVGDEPLSYPSTVAAEFASGLVKQAIYRAVLH